MHVYVRIERRWTFDEVRRAALALARDVERRAPALATSKWWKEERHGVFLDYNQNAKDRTVASAYSVRPTPDARVSAPLAWDEIADCDPADFTLATMPARFAAIGDRHADIDVTPDRSRRCSSCRRGRNATASATRRGRRTTASSPAKRRAWRRHAAACRSIRSSRSAARANKADALAGLERWKARHPDAAAHLEPADVLVDRDARPLPHVDAHPRQPAARARGPLRPRRNRSIPDEDPASEWHAAGAPDAPTPKRPRKTARGKPDRSSGA